MGSFLVENKTNETFRQLGGLGGGFNPQLLLQQQIDPHHTVDFSGNEATVYYLSDQHHVFVVEPGSHTEQVNSKFYHVQKHQDQHGITIYTVSLP